MLLRKWTTTSKKRQIGCILSVAYLVVLVALSVSHNRLGSCSRRACRHHSRTRCSMPVFQQHLKLGTNKVKLPRVKRPHPREEKASFLPEKPLFQARFPTPPEKPLFQARLPRLPANISKNYLITRGK